MGKPSESSSPPLTINNLLLTFKEFFVVWINQILYYNKVYDVASFDQFKSFELLVYKNRNPDLQKYVDDIIVNIINNFIINQNGIKEIKCVIYNEQTNELFRKFVLTFHNFIIDLKTTIGTLNNDINDDVSAKISIDGIDWSEIYCQFNSILFHHIQELKRIHVEEENHNSFKILVDLDELINNATTSNWVRLQPSHIASSDLQSEKYIAVGNVDFEVLCFDLHNQYV